MCQVLKFLVARLRKRPVLKNRVLEVLTILLGDSSWLRVAQLYEETRLQLRGLYEANDVMKARLDGEASGRPAPMEPAAKQTNALDKQQGDEVRNQLLAGIKCMEEYGWTFPQPSATCLQRDSAVEGFKSFYAGVTRLDIPIEKESSSASEEYVEGVLKDLAEFWHGVLQFLTSMYVERRTFAALIHFVVSKLSNWLPAFRATAEAEAPMLLKRPSDAPSSAEGSLERHLDEDDEALATELQQECDEKVRREEQRAQIAFDHGLATTLTATMLDGGSGYASTKPRLRWM